MTKRHKLFSVDRGDWIRAGNLEPSEYLKTKHGPNKIVSIESLPGVHQVYNIEVETDHCYFVTSGGVLCHNVSGCGQKAPKCELQARANEIRKAGQHPAARNNRTIAVGEDANGNLHAGSSNGFDHGQREAADNLGVNRVPSRKGNHAEENLMDAVENLRKVGTSKRNPCGPGEKNCAGRLRERGIEVDNVNGT